MIKAPLSFALALTLAGPGTGATAQTASDAIPDAPFKTVHFLKATAVQEAELAQEIDGLNLALSREGCASCAYHVFKMYSGPPTQYGYMVTADWPGRGEYVRLHASAGYRDASRKSSVMSDLSRSEIYGRYVLIK